MKLDRAPASGDCGARLVEQPEERLCITKRRIRRRTGLDARQGAGRRGRHAGGAIAETDWSGWPAAGRTPARRPRPPRRAASSAGAGRRGPCRSRRKSTDPGLRAGQPACLSEHVGGRAVGTITSHARLDRAERAPPVAAGRRLPAGPSGPHGGRADAVRPGLRRDRQQPAAVLRRGGGCWVSPAGPPSPPAMSG